MTREALLLCGGVVNVLGRPSVGDYVELRCRGAVDHVEVRRIVDTLADGWTSVDVLPCAWRWRTSPPSDPSPVRSYGDET